MIKFRPGNIEELLLYIEFLKQDFDDIPQFHNYDYSWTKAINHFRFIIDNNNGIFIVAEIDGEIAGFIFGFVLQYWFAEDYYTTDQGLFVRRKFRNKKVGYKLLEKFIEVSKNLGVRNFSTGIQVGTFNFDSMHRLLERKDFKKTAEIYQLDFKI